MSNFCVLHDTTLISIHPEFISFIFGKIKNKVAKIAIFPLYLLTQNYKKIQKSTLTL